MIGPGRLGLLVAQRWRRAESAANIFLKFRSENEERTKALTAEGFKVITEGKDDDVRVERVVFCAPPTGNPNYAADVEQGFNYLKSGGVYVFTSSGSVYEENSGATINEESETNKSERSKNLIDAEKVIIKKGGCVVRLGGLYSLESGAHNYFAKGGEFNSKGDGIINLVHYEDAAAAVTSCLENTEKVRGEVLLVSDGVPISRTEIYNATKKCSLYSSSGAEVKFTGGPGEDGKRYDPSKIRSLLGWKPSHPSFEGFISTL